MGLRPRDLVTLVLGLVIGLGLAAQSATASDWPTRPVRFILTLGAGSGSDIGARLFADRLSRHWGQPVVVENRPGGDGLVAINAFVSSHDDHVLLFAPSSSFTAHPYLHDHLPYKPSDLVPIARVSNTVIVVAVPVNMQVSSLAELVALARAEPGKLNWAGVTGADDFIFAGWIKRAGLVITEVPYRNPVDAANDLAEGRVQIYRAALAIVRPQLESGKIKLLAVTSSARAPSEPNVPTAEEAGFGAMTFDGLVGLFGPPGMPLALRERIASDIRAVADATIADRLAATGQIMNIGGPEQFGASIDAQRAKIAAFARDLGIAPLPGN
jgi:tripartite-type tricarboxylate transporter receptor subunit TctC